MLLASLAGTMAMFRTAFGGDAALQPVVMIVCALHAATRARSTAARSIIAGTPCSLETGLIRKERSASLERGMRFCALTELCVA